MKPIPPMSMFMLGVAALIMHARRAKADPTMKNHRPIEEIGQSCCENLS
jgi:hypothetical protein